MFKPGLRDSCSSGAVTVDCEQNVTNGTLMDGKMPKMDEKVSVKSTENGGEMEENVCNLRVNIEKNETNECEGWFSLIL